MDGFPSLAAFKAVRQVDMHLARLGAAAFRIRRHGRRRYPGPGVTEAHREGLCDPMTVYERGEASKVGEVSAGHEFRQPRRTFQRLLREQQRLDDRAFATRVRTVDECQRCEAQRLEVAEGLKTCEAKFGKRHGRACGEARFDADGDDKFVMPTSRQRSDFERITAPDNKGRPVNLKAGTSRCGGWDVPDEFLAPPGYRAPAS